MLLIACVKVYVSDRWLKKYECSVASNEKESNFRGGASYYVMMKDYGGKPFFLCNNTVMNYSQY